MKKPETALKSNGAHTVAGKIFSRWETFLVLIFLTVNIININLSPYYLNYNNLMDAMINFMDKGLMVYGTMMVLVLGEIDISIASIITLSACVAGWCGEQGLPFAACVCVALLVGALCGAFNGMLLVKFPELNSTIVTLGTQILFRGIAYMLLEDQSLKTYAKQLSHLAWGKILGLPVILFSFIVLTVIFGFLIHRTTFGRRLFAPGTNRTASHFSGIHCDRIKMIVFTVNGLCAAFAGLFLAAKLHSVRASYLRRRGYHRRSGQRWRYDPGRVHHRPYPLRRGSGERGLRYSENHHRTAADYCMRSPQPEASNFRCQGAVPRPEA